MVDLVNFVAGAVESLENLVDLVQALMSPMAPVMLYIEPDAEVYLIRAESYLVAYFPASLGFVEILVHRQNCLRFVRPNLVRFPSNCFQPNRQFQAVAVQKTHHGEIYLHH
jgi:hypothetical protein